MRNRIQHLRRDERGMSFVFVGVGGYFDFGKREP